MTRKVPAILQMEATECGAASLAMILAYHHCHIPLEELRQECGVSRDGSKASNILKAASQYGLGAKAYKKEPQQLGSIALPAILHWNFNHFVVLEHLDSRKARIVDPAWGRKTVSMEELDQAFTGVVLTFTKSPEFKRRGKKPGIFRTLAEYLKGARPALIFVFLAGLALLVPGLLIPLFTRVFVDKVLSGGVHDWIAPLLIAMSVAALLRAGFVWAKESCILKLETALALAGSSRFFWHVLYLPISFFSQRYAGEISNRINLNDDIARTLSGTLASSFVDLVLAVLFLVLLAVCSPLIALTSLGIACLMLLFTFVTADRIKDAYLRLIKDQGQMAGFGMTGVQMMETLKSMAREPEFFGRLAGYQTRQLSSEQELGKLAAFCNSGLSLFAALNTILVLLIGGKSVMDGETSLGTLIAMQSLSASFLEPVFGLSQLGVKIQELRGNIVRTDDILKHPANTMEAVAQGNEHQKLEGHVEIRDLCFAYTKHEPLLIEGFNLVLDPGTRVALVGGSGSGKSTVAKLVAGLYEPSSGSIRLDYRERTAIAREILCDSLAMVDQDLAFFEGTIKDNITLGDSTISEESVLAAARDACIHDDISRRPGAYNSMVEENGRNLSGGQKQRLEIARALARNPRILILDEATSALDAHTEMLVDQNLRRRGCTTILVAHRLSTIRDCHQILVLDKGHIVERGTHQSLMELEGHYFRLIGMDNG